jgi:hypothetical protein
LTTTRMPSSVVRIIFDISTSILFRLSCIVQIVDLPGQAGQVEED